MSLPVTAEPLPTSITFGKVVGRVIHLIADTAEDTDDKPQARAAAGKVTFTPKNVVRTTTEPDYSAFVLHAPEEATLSATGRILDREGRQGIWLAAGEYEVTFSISGGGRASIPSFPINVTTEHTDAAPLDLAKEVPYVPPSGTTVQTVLIPSGGTTGQVLVRAADGSLVWADQTADVDLTGYVTDQELTDAIAAIPDPDLSGYATTTALSDGLATNSTGDRARANHTGTQPATTVTGLADVATTGAYADLTGTPTIPAAYTDEQVRDVIGTTIVTGAGLSKTVDDDGNIVTLAATGSYTDEQVRDVLGTTLVGGTNVTVTPDDAANTVTISAAGGEGGGTEGPPGPVGMVWRGPWDTDFSYAADDGVSYDGRSFIALQPSTGIAPPGGVSTPADTAYWGLLADRGAQGEEGPAGSGDGGNGGEVAPSDVGLLGWSFDPIIHINASGATANSECCGILVPLLAGTISRIKYHVWTAGSGLTNAELAIIDAVTGDRIAHVTNQVANMQSTGFRDVAIDEGTVSYGGGLTYVVALAVGTSMPQFPRGQGNSDLLNSTGAGARIRSGRIGPGGITTIPTTLDLGQNLGGPRAFFFAVEGVQA